MGIRLQSLSTQSRLLTPLGPQEAALSFRVNSMTATECGLLPACRVTYPQICSMVYVEALVGKSRSKSKNTRMNNGCEFRP